MPYGVQLYHPKIALDLTRKINMNDIPNFAVWDAEALIKFSADAYRKMQEQQDILMQLQGDLKTAMENYRKLMMENNK